MASKGVITVTAALLCLILGLLSPVPAALGFQAGKACCTRYNRKPVPFQVIKGYREQLSTENCRIDAIIFYTVRKNTICATRKDEWVRKNLELLSLKLRTMSKTGSAGGEIHKKKSENPSNPPLNNRSGPLSSTTETYTDHTERVY